MGDAGRGGGGLLSLSNNKPSHTSILYISASIYASNRRNIEIHKCQLINRHTLLWMQLNHKSALALLIC